MSQEKAPQPEAPKEKDVTAAVRKHVAIFNTATSKMDRPFRGKNAGPNELYLLQREFAYLLNDIMQAPRALQQACIEKSSQFLDDLMQRLQVAEAETAKK